MTSQSRMIACLCAFVLGAGACAPERGGIMRSVQHISVYIDLFFAKTSLAFIFFFNSLEGET